MEDFDNIPSNEARNNTHRWLVTSFDISPAVLCDDPQREGGFIFAWGDDGVGGYRRGRFTNLEECRAAFALWREKFNPNGKRSHLDRNALAWEMDYSKSHPLEDDYVDYTKIK
jgi:hypothetical protein